jgi:Domain of unknown function (DUF4287)
MNMATSKSHSADSSAATPPATEPAEKVKGPASYFPSIEKTYGKPIAEWKAMIRTAGTSKHGELVTWLKTEHAMGHGHANALVAHTLAEQPSD